LRSASCSVAFLAAALMLVSTTGLAQTSSHPTESPAAAHMRALN
jgi:hypothetical protein